MTNNAVKILLFIIFAVTVCSISYGSNIYTVERINNKIVLKFNDYWYFERIRIPAHSMKIWGDHHTHNIISIEFNNEKHILSLPNNNEAKFLEISASSKAINTILLSSINISSNTVKEQIPEFYAKEQNTKQIEDNLLLVLENEKNNITQNKCFSCHTLIPTAQLIQTADLKKYRLNKSAINNLFIEVTSLANQDGSYFFEQQPCYGRNTTTLSAAYVLALMSDFMPTTFLKTGNKIKQFINSINKDGEPVKADFLFAPFFDSETTTLLHEIVFQKYMYLKDNKNNANCNERATSLINKINKNKLSFQQKLILLCGMPYSYQLPPEERKETIEQLKNHIQNSKSKTGEKLRLTSLLVYNKIMLELPKSQSNIKEINNKSQIIWNCLEKILYNNPKYLDGSYDD